MKGVSKYEKKLFVFLYEGDTVKGYDGKENVEFNKKDMFTYQKKYTTIFLTGIDKSMGLERAYKKYYNSAMALKEATGKRVNMFKSGGFPKTAIDLWQKLGFSKDLEITPNVLEKEEEQYIIDGTQGAIVFNTRFVGTGYQYDFKSFYLSILSSLYFLIPFRRGTSKTIKDFSEMTFFNRYSYGYYRCVIHKSNNYETDRFFKFNKNNVYTHFDLQCADILKLKKEMIIDDKPNCYIYTRKELVTGYQIFNKFTKYVWNLKYKKIEGAKLLSTSLWGGLCQSNHKTITLSPEEPEPKENIIKITQNLNDNTISYYIRKKQAFAYEWARFKPFLLSKGRLIYVETVLNHADTIVRAHTDSFTSTKKLDIEIGDKLGQIEYEGYITYSLENNKIKKKINKNA